jgi:hypothetical protein
VEAEGVPGAHGFVRFVRKRNNCGIFSNEEMEGKGFR